MLQIIGLIVAVYAIARIVQVPLEMTATKDVWLGMPHFARVAIVFGVSVIALAFLLLLTMMLLFVGVDTGPAHVPRPRF